MSRAAAALLFACLVAVSSRATAFSTDRIAVELAPGEAPLAGVVEFERACWQLGVAVEGATWIQPFVWQGHPFERLAVSGSPDVVRCLENLGGGRRGVDGTFTWADGFQGGLVVPIQGREERIADPLWFDPTATPAMPKPDGALVQRLAAGDAKAISDLTSRPLEEAVADVTALAQAGGPKAAAVLESIATTSREWLVRRTATLALLPPMSTSTLEKVARSDASWEVRLAAVDRLRTAASAGLPGFPNEAGPERLLVDVARHDASWVVRREALWQLTSAAVTRAKDEVEPLIETDADARVRSTALLVLAGAGLDVHSKLVRALDDASPIVRAAAAGVLAQAPAREDLPKLWRAFTSSDRSVRIAATPVLRRLEDATIAPTVWREYETEADQLDADPDALRTMERFLEREPFPGLGKQIARRLATKRSPDEERLLSRLEAHVDATAATKRLLPLFASKDPARRALAAECAPSTPKARNLRHALLDDGDANVRAAAVIGSCEVDGVRRDDVLSAVLEPNGLGVEAMQLEQTCGRPPVTVKRFRTHLAGAAPEGESPSTWPAMAGMALLLASVVLTKLRQKA